MLTNYSLVGLFLLVAIGLAVVTLLIPTILGFFRIVPHKPTPVKGSTCECGMETIGKTWVQFNFRYYVFALLFVALDVLVIFLYPWAVELRQLGSFGFIAIFSFILIVLTGYIYAWRKKVLEWK